MARVPVSTHQTAFWTAFDGSGRSGSSWGQMAPIPHLFPHFNPSDATLCRRLVYHGSGVTASPVCSPSGWTKEYEIYGGVGFSGENAQIVASTARVGGAWPNEGLGLIPPVRPRRRLLLMILFQGCGSQGGGLAPRQLAVIRTFFCGGNRRERVGGRLVPAPLPASSPGGGMWGVAPTGRPGGGQGGPDTPPTQGATHHTPQHL